MALERLQAELGVDKSAIAGVDKAGSGKPEKKQEPVKTGVAKGGSIKANRNDSKLQQAQLNIEIAQELMVNDYFVLYLNQFKDKDAFLEAAKKLNPDEMAELMMAYKRHLSGTSQADTQPPELLGGVGQLGSTRPVGQGM